MAKTKGIGIPSPTETIQTEIQGSKISLTYGRPYKRGRTIFGGVVPYDTLWRTGANGPTIEIIEAKNNGEIRFSWDDVVAVARFEVMK